MEDFIADDDEDEAESASQESSEATSKAEIVDEIPDLDAEHKEARPRKGRLRKAAPMLTSGPPSAEEKGKQKWQPPPEDDLDEDADLSQQEPGPSRVQLLSEAASPFAAVEGVAAAGTGDTADVTGPSEPRNPGKRLRGLRTAGAEPEKDMDYADAPQSSNADAVLPTRRSSRRVVQSKPSVQEILRQHKVCSELFDPRLPSLSAAGGF